MGLLDKVESFFGGGSYKEILQWAELEGGFPAIIDKLRQGGLTDIVQSWIGKEDSLPISSEQLQQALGSDTVQKLAEKVGVDPTQATDLLSKYLPEVVNRLTPDGDEAGLTNVKGLLASGIDFIKNKL